MKVIGSSVTGQVEFSGFSAYPPGMEDVRDLEPNREFDNTPPAPGELELVRGFLSLHDHVPVTEDSLPPTRATIEWWLREHGLLDPGAEASDADLDWATDVLEALRA